MPQLRAVKRVDKDETSLEDDDQLVRLIHLLRQNRRLLEIDLYVHLVLCEPLQRIIRYAYLVTVLLVELRQDLKVHYFFDVILVLLGLFAAISITILFSELSL